ncbi:biotin-dependent carboxyltransferase family protein [Tolumonas lignilytica]|jgi:biotin-dependent carboxylase uncharacterized domain|uniref:5-oxoprolinase subunit C family protein n=1 Tax=Tolumonas lignilytica TaxID=1283284 RepID=UPI0004637B4D|nr:biotin-dependent carboxyltransferase family protein [Tolumonas lignilytica]
MIEILQAGPLVSVQDLGRHGLRHQGVSQAGALDGLSLLIANRLLANDDHAAGLEMFYGLTQIRFHKDTWFALAGCECFATLNQKPVLLGWARKAKVGDILTLNSPRNGLCAYLAVAGGIDVPSLMGARATDVQAGFGGYAGRKLQNGDQLLLGKKAHRKLMARGVLLPPLNQAIRVLAGAECHEFTDEAQQAFFNHGWRVSSDSNRMGFRLEGETLSRTVQSELLSQGVFPGVIQVPHNGQPIMLAAEAQATGGYPRIATIIQADLWKLGQLRPGVDVHFKLVSRAEAASALSVQQRYLARISLGLNKE